jgi:hypothetical protein
MINGTVNADLLGNIPNAPDGVGWFSATDGAGANRFGVANGNLLTGHSAGTAQNVMDDYYAVVAQLLSFLNPKGQPIWSESDIDAGLLIIYGIADVEVFEEAFKQKGRLRIVRNVAGAENVAAAQVTNIVEDSGRRVTLWGTPLMTNAHDWIAVMMGLPEWQKPVFKQMREALFAVNFNSENSLECAKNDEECIIWKESAGYGQFLPYQSIYVNN